MENKGLIFIPDISGFTKFINETEISHGRMIIQELLEIIINSNQIGLEISEIEGDAVLFYRYGEPPKPEELYKQIEKMFCEFHRNLSAYEQRRYCQCKACISAINLSLKVITHYGEFTGYNVKNFNKLIGKDIIVAHQLLKNDIDKHEYWLITDELLNDAAPAGFAKWMKWNSSAKDTESGVVNFHFTQLSDLKNEIKPDTPPQLEISSKVKVFSVTRDYEGDFIKLFHITGDFNNRSKWQEGVKKVEEVSHFLPRVGMKTKMIMDSGEVIAYSSSYIFTPDKIEFGETDDKKKNSTYSILEKLANGKVRFTLDYYIPKNPIEQLMFKIFRKKKLEESYRKSLANIDKLLKEVEQPVEA